MLPIIGLAVLWSLAQAVLFIPAIIAIRTDDQRLRSDRLVYCRWLMIYAGLAVGASAAIVLIGRLVDGVIILSQSPGSETLIVNGVIILNESPASQTVIVLFGFKTVIYMGMSAIFLFFAGWFIPRQIARRVQDCGGSRWVVYVATCVPIVNVFWMVTLLAGGTKVDGVLIDQRM